MRPKTGPTQCHDITVYPAIGLAGGACGGYGLLLDIPRPGPPDPHRSGGRLEYAQGCSFWHSATFNNDGTKILFSDEGRWLAATVSRKTEQARMGCRRDLHVLVNKRMTFKSYYKMSAPQTSLENWCRPQRIA